MNPVIGSSIFDIITAGMYSDPLMIIREYLQNACDSIDQAVDTNVISKSAAKIMISIDGAKRNLHISDNGIGMSVSDAESIMGNLGLSTKLQSLSRGHRGIGRLAGVGYCKELLFITRTNNSNWVSEARWDCDKARSLLAAPDCPQVVGKFMKDLFSLKKRKARSDEANHFMRVELNGIIKFHDDRLMMPTIVGKYISKVAPLPFDESNFSNAQKIIPHISNFFGVNNYNIYLNGIQLYKPYHDDFFGRAKSIDKISDIELFTWSGKDADELARGWVAITQYKASLPPSTAMRGLVVRQGNILVGDEYFLAERYTERRFSTWHIGEIHVSQNLRTNARRDGFEHGTSFEMLLEKATLLCRELSRRCRESSKARNLSHFKNNSKPLFYAGPLHKTHYHQTHKNIDADEVPLLNEILNHTRLSQRQSSDVLVEIAELLAQNYNKHRNYNDLAISIFNNFIKKKFQKE